MKQLKRIFIGTIILCSTYHLRAQETSVDTTKTIQPTSAPQIISADTNTALQADTSLPFITPKKKAMYSAIIPGLGQIYNKQYWKLPIIYAGLGTAGYFIYNNNKQYNYFREIYAGRIANKQEFIGKEALISTDNIKKLSSAWKQDRDMVVLVTVLVYGLQVMDALVFAHLKDFDISDDISMKFAPVIIPNNYAVSPTYGIGLQFKLK
jgi:hypothetical protein